MGGPGQSPGVGREAAPAYLEGLLGQTSTCKGRWVKWSCGCGVRVTRNVCLAKSCVETDCVKRASVRRASRVEARLAGKVVCETVFTVPPALRGRFVDAKEWGRVRRAAWGILKRAGASYGCEASHPVGDKSPDVFAPHLNFLWVPKSGRGLLDVDALRAAWGFVLGAVVVDVHHSFVLAGETGKLRHRCRYVTRPFARLAKWCGNVKWYGKPPALPEPDEIPPCPKCGEHLRCEGRISEAEALSIQRGTLWRKYGHSFPCPDLGVPLIPS